jgi:acyl-CoA synthetase (AMP-forming)/AMP-acid ligase II
MVTGTNKNKIPLVQHLINPELAQNQVIVSSEIREDTRTLVSCGQNISDQEIKIVNLETLAECNDDEVGEIWVSGSSVACGYWNKPSETAFTFDAKMANNTKESFLRTGDLGFLHEGELYITGRIKNLVICEGKNHYPHDIERTIEASHPAIRQSGCAVFSVDRSGTENIVVIAEIDYRSIIKSEEVIKAIREAVSMDHGLHVNDIVLTNPGRIPKTTSGKIKHFLCKEYYLADAFNEIKAI